MIGIGLAIYVPDSAKKGCEVKGLYSVELYSKFVCTISVYLQKKAEELRLNVRSIPYVRGEG